MREETRVTPLINGAETFCALAEAITGATDSIQMAYWALDPEYTAPRSGGRGWGDLLAAAAERGVRVQLLLSDFDPLLGHALHARAVAAQRAIEERRQTLSGAAGARLDARRHRHPAHVCGVWGPIDRLVRRKQLRRLIAAHSPADMRAVLRAAPGLADAVKVREDSVRIGRVGETAPAVHHEKTCVIDGRISFVGGMDIDELRDDDGTHASDRPWHDITLKIESRPIAEGVAAHFAARWREAKGETFVLPETRAADTRRLQIVGSAARPSQNPLRMTPRCIDRSFAQALDALIGSAREEVFIATQYLRSGWAASRIARALRRRPDLSVIILLPLAPEHIIDAGKAVDPATRHAQWLQRRALTRIVGAAPVRVGLFTLLRDGPRPRDQERNPFAEKRGSDLVYVHAKTLIVDGETAIVGSPNLNDRSLFMDTERAVVWRDGPGVSAFRDRLFSALLGDAGEDAPGETGLQQWRNAAIENARRPRGERGGFAVPAEIDELCQLAKWHPLVHSRFV